MAARRYYLAMGEHRAHLTLKLETDEPIELGDFVGAFTSLANEFERYVEATYPGSKASPTLYVRDVRRGSVVADMITEISGVVAAASSVPQAMDQIMVLEDFVKRWGARVTSLITNNISRDELSKPGELDDFLKAAQSIASDPIGGHRIEAAIFEDGRREVRASFTFSAVEARAAAQNIEDRKRLLAQRQNVPHSRVLMRFTRTDVHDASVNKRSGERVVIDQLSDQDIPVIYASELVEREIRDIIREADENVYKRGFVVDVMTQTVNARIVAYAVTGFHSVIDIE